MGIVELLVGAAFGAVFAGVLDFDAACAAGLAFFRAADFLAAEISVTCRSKAFVALAGPAIMVAITMAGSKLGLFLDANVCSLNTAESMPGANVYSVDNPYESQLVQKPDQSLTRTPR
jgi:hypothetical protein